MLKNLGGSASPFDAGWPQRPEDFRAAHGTACENAIAIAQYLEQHPKGGGAVHYPGLESHPQHAIAARQMLAYGGMLSFELKGGLEAGISLMDHLRLASLAPTLGNLETLVQHPASMSHASVKPEERQRMGIADGLVRLSVGIENLADIIADLEQALAY